jgi:hypothetical protein
MALAALPALLIPALVGFAMSRAPLAPIGMAAGVVEGLVVSAALALVAWRSNPWPRREIVDVRADALALEVEGESVARETMRDGFVVPAGNETRVVIHRKGAAPALELITQGVGEARRVLIALGFDASQTVARFRTLSRVFADLRYLFAFALLPFVALLATGAFRANGNIASLPGVAFFGLLLTFGVLAMFPSRVTVGADGVEIAWLGRRRFFRHRDILVASRYEAGLGNSRYAGVALALQSGEEVRIPVNQARSGDERTAMILERIDEAAAIGKREHLELDASVLARGGREVADWMRALRSLGAGANATMRTAPIEAERLWRVVEDPTSAPLTRAAAAVALTADPAADSRRRLRAVAEATAAPRLRIAIDAAASHDEAALREALAELEADADASNETKA